MPRHALTDDELERMRARILAETAKVIAADGYARFSIRKLAEAVGLTPGALYRYFPNKQHLLFAYWAKALGELHARFERIDAAEAEPLPVLRKLMLAYAEFALDDSDRFRTLFLDAEFGEAIDVSRVPDLLAAYHLMHKRVAEAIARGVFRPLSPDTAARLLWAAVHGAVVLALTVQELDFTDIRDLVAEMTDTTLRGLSVSPVEG
jgi:AcrR family transcriptional regulator